MNLRSIVVLLAVALVAPLARAQTVPPPPAAATPAPGTAAPPPPASSVPAPALRPYGRADHGQHPHRQRTYTETWSWRFDLDDGRTLVMNWIVTNLGVFSGVCGLEVSLLEAGRPARVYSREFPLERWKAGAGRIECGSDNYVAGIPPAAHELAVSISKKGGFTAALKVRGAWPGAVDGREIERPIGRGQQFGHAVMFARGAVEGTITVGDKGFAVKGAAYGEHTVQTALATEFARTTYAVRFHKGDYTVVLLRFDLLGKFGGRQDGWALVYRAGRLLFATRDVKVVGDTPRRARNYEVPRRLTLTAVAAGGERLEGTFVQTGELQAFGMTDEMDAAAAAVVKMIVGNAVVFRETATADLKLTIPGLETPVLLKGPAFTEIARLNK